MPYEYDERDIEPEIAYDENGAYFITTEFLRKIRGDANVADALDNLLYHHEYASEYSAESAELDLLECIIVAARDVVTNDTRRPLSGD